MEDSKDRKKASAPAVLDPKKVFGRSPDQHILNVVKESCQEAFNLPSFNTTLQTIKSHFFDRNYDAVFQTPGHLPVYSARYAPSRALCYYHLFLEHPVLLKKLEGPSTVLCIGSGAGSELVGIAAAMVHVAPKTKKKKRLVGDGASDKDKDKKEKKKKTPGSVTATVTSNSEGPKEPLDVGKPTEDSSVETIATGIETLSTADPSSASAAQETPENEELEASKKSKSVTFNTPALPTSKHLVKLVIQDYVDWSRILDPMERVVHERMQLGADRLACETEIGNVLDLSEGLLARIAKADLITFMFVLNELFQDKKRTMLLVAKIVAAMPSGAHMLVVDSAGSFSNLKVGERVYMVYMLLDHLKDLEIVYQDDATWYRCPPSLTYPLKLENMRHFVRIYKKI
ncbi:25S rRNA (uracil2843-N3)-methyltransferase [Entomortierella parvispora]|uniref:25S rRNA (Uracil2843-N3)-methyltransferase n=1 Tax=Entomortierella parvispora TaxID=205924 RepID=A0A9P3H871_9FUNG|nr:25S rRNA (uracil2843-N3)-methyltransferase [Entomortierella parvispora]